MVERPNLPAAPGNFGTPVAAPTIRKGASLKVVAAENRAALHTANNRLTADKDFYDAVRRDFGGQ